MKSDSSPDEIPLSHDSKHPLSEAANKNSITMNSLIEIRRYISIYHFPDDKMFLSNLGVQLQNNKPPAYMGIDSPK